MLSVLCRLQHSENELQLIASDILSLQQTPVVNHNRPHQHPPAGARSVPGPLCRGELPAVRPCTPPGRPAVCGALVPAPGAVPGHRKVHPGIHGGAPGEAGPPESKQVSVQIPETF